VTWEATATFVAAFIALGIAIVGWKQAARANRQAEAAVTAASTANQIATDSNTIAETSSHAATKSNEIAEKALALSEQAEERAAHAERISLERREVHWEQSNPGAALEFRNAGTSSAYEVHLTITWNAGRTHENEGPHAKVEPGHGIRIPTADIHTTQDKASPSWRGEHPTGQESFHVTARLTWRSEAGAPASQVFDDVWV
jgi:hypothetical protein